MSNPYTITDQIRLLEAKQDAINKKVRVLRAEAASERATRRLFWERREREKLQEIARLNATLQANATELAKLRAQQRAMSVKPLRPQLQASIITKFKAVKQTPSTLTYTAPPAMSVPKPRVAVVDVYRATPITRTTAPQLVRHYHALIAKYSGRLRAADDAFFRMRLQTARRVAGVTSPRIRAVEAELATYRARFERVRASRNYAESTRINDAIARLEAQLRAMQMEAATSTATDTAPTTSTFSPVAPVEYTAPKAGGGDAAPEADPESAEPQAATDTTPTDEATEDAPWYKRPVIVVGAIALAALAASRLGGKKGKSSAPHTAGVHS